MKRHLPGFLDKSAPTSKPTKGNVSAASGSKEGKGSKGLHAGAFLEFELLCTSLEKTSSYTAKTELIRSNLNLSRPDLYIFCKLLLPGQDKRVYGLKETQLIKILSGILGVDAEKLSKGMEEGSGAGDLSVVAEKAYLEASEKAKSSSTLTLDDIDQALEELKSCTKEHQHSAVLSKVIEKCNGQDLKYFIRLILKDLRMSTGPKHVLSALSSDAYEMWQHRAELKPLIEELQNRERGSDSVTVKSPKKGGNAKKNTGSDAESDGGGDGARKNEEKGKKAPASKGGKAKTATAFATVVAGTFIKPQLADSCKSYAKVFSKGRSVMFAETKYDGERLQAHWDGTKLVFYSRSGAIAQANRTDPVKQYVMDAFPKTKSFILDGEVVLVDTTTGTLHPFGYLGVHKRQEVKDASLCLFLFDILYLNGESLTSKPLSERRNILAEHTLAAPNHIELSRLQEVRDEAEMEVLMDSAIDQGLEGLVLKDPKGPYEPGKRRWLKLKKDSLGEGAMADSADLVCLGSYYGSGSKGGMQTVFLMGCFDPDANIWKTVCKAGNGFDDAALARLQGELDLVKTNRDPAKMPPWLSVARALTPDFIVADPKTAPVWEVQGAQFSHSKVHSAQGISIRFPRVCRVRNDKSWKEATSLPELCRLVEASKLSGATLVAAVAGKGKGKGRSGEEKSESVKSKKETLAEQLQRKSTSMKKSPKMMIRSDPTESSSSSSVPKLKQTKLNLGVSKRDPRPSSTSPRPYSPRSRSRSPVDKGEEKKKSPSPVDRGEEKKKSPSPVDRGEKKRSSKWENEEDDEELARRELLGARQDKTSRPKWEDGKGSSRIEKHRDERILEKEQGAKSESSNNHAKHRESPPTSETEEEVAMPRKRSEEKEDSSPKRPRKEKGKDSPKKEDSPVQKSRTKEDQDEGSPKRPKKGDSPKRSENGIGDRSPKRPEREVLDTKSPKRAERESGDTRSPKRAEREYGDTRSPKRSEREYGDTRSPKRSEREYGDTRSPKRSERERDTKSPKRLSQWEPSPSRRGPRKPCPYGSSCYRRNPVHRSELAHPGDRDWTERSPKPKTRKSKVSYKDADEGDEEPEDASEEEDDDWGLRPTKASKKRGRRPKDEDSDEDYAAEKEAESSSDGDDDEEEEIEDDDDWGEGDDSEDQTSKKKKQTPRKRKEREQKPKTESRHPRGNTKDNGDWGSRRTRSASPGLPSDVPVCRYGATCYRTNPSHFLEYSHPGRDPGPRSSPARKDRTQLGQRAKSMLNPRTSPSKQFQRSPAREPRRTREDFENKDESGDETRSKDEKDETKNRDETRGKESKRKDETRRKYEASSKDETRRKDEASSKDENRSDDRSETKDEVRKHESTKDSEHKPAKETCPEPSREVTEARFGKPKAATSLSKILADMRKGESDTSNSFSSSELSLSVPEEPRVSLSQDGVPLLPTVFQGFEVFIEGDIGSDRNDYIRRFFTAFDGDVSSRFGNTTTHVIYDGPWSSVLDEYRAKNKSCVFVRPDWALDCIKKKELIDEGPYTIGSADVS